MVEKSWSRKNDKKSYRAPMSRKRACVKNSMLFASSKGINVNFGPRPDYGDDLTKWQENVMEVSKKTYEMIISSGYERGLLSKKEEDIYRKGLTFSDSKYQSIVSKVVKETEE